MTETVTTDDTKGENRKLACGGGCSNVTNHTVLASVKYSWGDDDIQGVDKYEVVGCRGCNTISFRQVSSNSESYYQNEETHEIDYYEEVHIYPSRIAGRRPLEDLRILPNEIGGIYKETHAAMCNELPRLTAVGVRLIVELVCKHLGAKGENLKQRINDLVTKGLLTQSNADVLHQTRLFGNEGAHEAQVPKESHLSIAMDIAEALLMNVFVIPHKAQVFGTDKSKPNSVKAL